MIDTSSSEILIFLAVLLSAVATFITRVTPFCLIQSDKSSRCLMAIQKHIGIMIMVVLVCYALKDTKFDIYPYGLREIIGVAVAILIHIKFKNILLSIAVSTGVYMLCIKII